MTYGNIGIVEISPASKIHNGEAGRKKMVELFKHLEGYDESGIIYPGFTGFNKELIDISEYKKINGDNTLCAITDERFSKMEKYTVLRRKNGEKYKLKEDAVILIEIKLIYVRQYHDGKPEPCVLDENQSERDRFESESIKWAEKKFSDKGSGKDNIAMAMAHYDEENPHIHIVVCPEHNGKYDQNYFIGGPAKINSIIKSYNKMMHEKFGLDILKPEIRARNSSSKRTRRTFDESIFNRDHIIVEENDTPMSVSKKANEIIKDINGYYAGIMKSKQRENNELEYKVSNPHTALSVKLKSEQRRLEYFRGKNRELGEKQRELMDKYLSILKILSESSDSKEGRNEALRFIYSDPEFAKKLTVAEKSLNRIKKETSKNERG